LRARRAAACGRVTSRVSQPRYDMSNNHPVTLARSPVHSHSETPSGYAHGPPVADTQPASPGTLGWFAQQQRLATPAATPATAGGAAPGAAPFAPAMVQSSWGMPAPPSQDSSAAAMRWRTAAAGWGLASDADAVAAAAAGTGAVTDGLAAEAMALRGCPKRAQGRAWRHAAKDGDWVRACRKRKTCAGEREEWGS